MKENEEEKKKNEKKIINKPTSMKTAIEIK